MRAKFAGNKPDRVLMVVKNAEASSSIPRGTPVVLNMSDTAAANDGLDVVLPATAGSAKSFAFRFGVVTDTLAVGDFGNSILFGHVPYALITRATRAASTDSWSASASTASGIALGLDTLNNAFLMGASIAGSIASNHADAFLVDSLAAVVTSASATSDSRTAITVGARVFVRML